MTPRQLAIIDALRAVTFLQASAQKRFARDMATIAKRNPAYELSENQARYLTAIAWRFRRQMPAHLAYPETDDERAVFAGAPR